MRRRGRCQACGWPLLPEDDPQADFCGRRECLTRREVARPDLVRLRQMREAAWLAVTRKRTEAMMDAARQRAGSGNADRMASGLAPFVDRPLTTLPPERRRAFETHLRNTIRDSFAAHGGDIPPLAAEDDPQLRRRLASEQPEPAVLSAACAACRGDCCLPGGERQAFIGKTTIDRYRRRHPEATPDDIAAFYLGHLPERSVELSCLYHGDGGCALPREARSSICNAFLCWYRRALDEDHARRPGHGAVVVAVARDHLRDPSEGAPRARVVSVTEAGQITEHPDLTLPALSEAELAPYRRAAAAVNRQAERDRPAR